MTKPTVRDNASSEALAPDASRTASSNKTTGGIPSEMLVAMSQHREERPLGDYFDLERLLDQDIAGWRPNPGDKLIGTVVNLEIGGQGSTFGTYPLLTIRVDETGEFVNVHAFHTVLRVELGRKQVGMGDRIGIKYIGAVEGGDFGSYEAYKVVSVPQTGNRLALPDQIR